MASTTKPQARSKPPRRTQHERRESTRRALLDTGRELFARHGYAGTSLDAIVAAFGMTKGAFYHHFSGKEELFEAVYVEEQEMIAAELARTYAARRARDPVQASLAACRRFLEISREPSVQRITLLDGPAVLGWMRMREIEADYGLAMLKEGIRNAMTAKQLRRHDVDALAHVLFGALCEGAIYMAGERDQGVAQRKVEREFRAIVEALVAVDP